MQQKGSTKPDTSYLKELIQATQALCAIRETRQAQETAARVRLIDEAREASRGQRDLPRPWSPERRAHSREGMACRPAQKKMQSAKQS